MIVVAGDPTHHIKASDTKCEGRLSEREINVYAAAGNFRSGAGEEVCGPAQGVSDYGCRRFADADLEARKMLDASEAFHPIWIVDFPMFEYDLTSGKWVPAHHPFTSPHEADMAEPRAAIRRRCARTATTWR